MGDRIPTFINLEVYARNPKRRFQKEYIQRMYVGATHVNSWEGLSGVMMVADHLGVSISWQKPEGTAMRFNNVFAPYHIESITTGDFMFRADVVEWKEEEVEEPDVDWTYSDGEQA